MAGQILGDRYEIEKQIGKQTGRWSLIARDLTTQQRVIIKLLFLDEQLDWDDLKLFEREVEILKSISHPSIPQYLSYFEHQLLNDKALALVRDYIDGRSLQQCMDQGRIFSEPEAKQIGKALLLILTYLHGRQPPIIHRDIKPSNILLANRQAYLVDFGSVKSLSGGDTTAFTVVGTYGYMPPEQFSGRAVPASDLYGVGETLIAILTGAHPSNLPRRGLKVDLGQIPNLSSDFKKWLAWMTEPSLEYRVKSAQEALQALEQEPQPSEPTPSAERPADTRITLTKTADSLEVTIPSLLGQTYLQIDQQQISLLSKRLGFQGRPLTSPRQSINKLEYRKTAESGAQENVEPQLIIWADSQKYELGGNPPLTQAELNWLAYELSTWLQLPCR